MHETMISYICLLTIVIKNGSTWGKKAIKKGNNKIQTTKSEVSLYHSKYIVSKYIDFPIIA